MSAYIVEDKTINTILAYLARGRDIEHVQQTIHAETGTDLTNYQSIEELGRAMFALNCRAVDARYGEGESQSFRDDMQYKYSTVLPPTCIQAYASLRCWLYQCSEGDVPDTSTLYATMERVSDQLAHHIVQSSKDFKNTRWG